MKKIILFVLIILLFIGISFATETDNNTKSIDKTTLQKDTNNNMNNYMIKKYNNEKVKKTSKNTKITYAITNFNNINTALKSNKYSEVTLNIKSDIN